MVLSSTLLLNLLIPAGGVQSATTDCDALSLAATPVSSVMDWRKVGSDEEAILCLTILTDRLDPHHMGEWFSRQGFRVKVGPLRQTSDRGTFVSAIWLNSGGILYNTTPLETAVSSMLAHSQVFSVEYTHGQSPVVRQVRVFK